MMDSSLWAPALKREASPSTMIKSRFFFIISSVWLNN
jgi:hypothetical protein